MTVKPSRNLFNPINVLTGLVIIVILFEGIAFTTDNIQNAADIEQNKDIRAILEDNRKAGDQRTDQLHLIEDLVEQQGNLSAKARAGLTKAINATYYEVFPDINEALQDIRNAQPQSNFTAQREGVANIEKILENQERIFRLLNATNQ